uniref:Uncharacterized protein n=1 Tax=Lepeophtheirus salmonis TaxID=72036 RepID=A0A0K2UEA0_LEPSM
MLKRVLSVKSLWRTNQDFRRCFFFNTMNIKEEYEDKKGVRDYLKNDYLRKRLQEHFLNESSESTLNNVFMTEVSAYFKSVNSDEDIELANKILQASFRDDHYQQASKYSTEIINRYFVLCLLKNLPDHATNAWKCIETQDRVKGKNMVLRFRQLLFTSGRYRDLIDLTIDKEDLYNGVSRNKWRDYWFYMSSLYEIGDRKSFEEASEWYWKVWDPSLGSDEKKISSLAIHWLYSLLALKNKEYCPAFHASFGKRDSICYQILLTIFLDTYRIEDAVDFLKDEEQNIKVIGTDIIRRLTASVKVTNNEDLNNELIKVCRELDARVRLEDRYVHEQVYEAMKGAEKRI